MTDDRLIVLGRVSGAYGVKGWLKIHSETDPVQNICRYDPWYLEINGSWQQTTLLQGRKHGKGVVAQLQNCDDRDQAEKLKGCSIAIKREQLPAIEDTDDVYWTDLEGLRVQTIDAVDLGTISHLFETGANDVMVVKGDRERLVPFIREQVIKNIDLEAGLITVDWDPEF